jgi:hypothetical protein
MVTKGRELLATPFQTITDRTEVSPLLLILARASIAAHMPYNAMALANNGAVMLLALADKLGVNIEALGKKALKAVVPDELFTCAKCGDGNFTKSGLKSHNCAKRKAAKAGAKKVAEGETVFDSGADLKDRVREFRAANPAAGVGMVADEFGLSIAAAEELYDSLIDEEFDTKLAAEVEAVPQAKKAAKKAAAVKKAKAKK